MKITKRELNEATDIIVHILGENKGQMNLRTLYVEYAIRSGSRLYEEYINSCNPNTVVSLKDLGY